MFAAQTSTAFGKYDVAAFVIQVDYGADGSCDLDARNECTRAAAAAGFIAAGPVGAAGALAAERYYAGSSGSGSLYSAPGAAPR